MDRQEVLDWLRCTEPATLEQLWSLADRVRHEYVGDAVHLRGLVEVSNFCARSCHYCGLRAANRKVERYRLEESDILECAHMAVGLGYGTLVLQGGEDDQLSGSWVARCIERIKTETSLAVTLSLGERSDADLALWRDAGADRYLLRFETSDTQLYKKIHPDRGARVSDRIAILKTLKRLGYETGSGIMVGIPGQRSETIADDILLFQELDLDMIGVGPFIAHPDTPLGGAQAPELEPLVSPSVEMTCKVLALTRIIRPDANIPATTAVATMDGLSGRAMALTRGANVIMPNLTPPRFRKLYAIYPGKACSTEAAQRSDREIRQQLHLLGRQVGTGPGGRNTAVKSVHTVREELSIAVCMGSSCYSRGNTGRVLETLRQCTESAGLIPKISGHLCENQCTTGPHVSIGNTLYSNVQVSCIPDLIKHHLQAGDKEKDG